MMPGIDQLRDIRGLDPLSWWPPAFGWWLVILVALVVLLALPFLWRYALGWWRRRVSGDWRGDAWRQLHALRDRLRWGDQRTVAADLSELLRRIAIARMGRRACAGLIDEEWLMWLEAHDPNGFTWRREGRILNDLPYAPPGARVSASSLEPLVAAAEEWTREEEPGLEQRTWQRARDATTDFMVRLRRRVAPAAATGEGNV